MKLIRVGLAASLLMTSAAVGAQSAKDAGCILVANAYAKNAKDENASKLAQATLYFFLGRISSTATATQLKTLLEAQAKTITDASAGNVMNACVKEFQGKVELIDSLGQQAKPPQKK